jgi:hypothetical protein
MVKKFSMLALAGLIAMPAIASASAGKAPQNLTSKIDELSRQLDALKAQMAQQNENIAEYGDKVDDMDEMLEEKSESWDLAARFKFYGDFRARYDYYNADTLFSAGTPMRFAGLNPATGMPLFSGVSQGDRKNTSIFTNRFRLNMRVKATENVEFKGRLAMYKAWGMQTTPNGLSDGANRGQSFPIFDGSITRQPGDSALYVDRAFMNWNNIGGAPIWFSIGRRPTTDGPPAQIRMGTDTRMATPIAYMDYPFDGISLGYAYAWGSEAMGTGRARFCYGRGFENGLQDDNMSFKMDDTDFAGISWDVMKKGNRFWNIQSFAAINLFNYPAFQSDLVNFGAPMPMEVGGFGPQQNVGNLYHTSTVFQDKYKALNWFVAGGWSHTDPNDAGMFNDYAAMGQQAMMGMMPETNTDGQDGYSAYAGVRYDFDNIGLKLGGEYNYGSQYWVAFTPGNDDLYQSKLATRGSAYEIYMIYDLPTGEAISKYAKTFIRLGYQYYDYSHAGGFDWNMQPYDLDDDRNQLQALGINPVKSANQVYLTFEAYF